VPHRLSLLAFLAGCSSPPPEWLGSLGRGGPAAADAPNVLVVSLDTLRSDHLGLHGYELDTAPTLSALAAEGAWMSRTWSQAPQTDGTHAAMFTGRFASTHGKFTHEQRLPESETTLAEHFRAEGYRTWAVATSLKFDAKSGFSQGFEDWDLYPDGPVVARGDDALGRAQQQMTGDDPWIGFLHLFDVHAPYTPPEPHRSEFLTGEPAVKPRKTVEFIRKNRRAQRIAPAKLASLVQLYDGGIHHVDSRVATIWEQLKASDRETILVITSDHGEAFHEHRYLGHSNRLWEEIVRVPWIVWAPGRVAPGQRIDAPAQSVDLLPTVAELAGLPPVPGTDGRSFTPALTGTGAAPPDTRPIVLQETGRWGVVQQIDGEVWKAIIRVRKHRRDRLAAGEELHDPKVRLYNLTTDPGETHNISNAHPEIRDALSARLAALGSDDPSAHSEQRDDFSDDELEGLRAIGYVD
jgi:arylsulfatase A-like enzyme